MTTSSSEEQDQQRPRGQMIRQGIQRAQTVVGAIWQRCVLLCQKLQPGPRQAKTRTPVQSVSWIDRFIDGAFLVVTSLAFLVFLVASLPHVAYFFAAFEPQQADGTVSDWWWFVAYLIAGTINITEFLLSIKFARELRNATRGLPFIQKIIPTLIVIFKYWPFILIIAGFSWAANLQHAREFHSDMLLTAESVSVTLPFGFMPYIKTWGDLNPYIVSAFPILNVAYTLMFDSSRNHEDLQLQSAETLKAESASTALQPVGSESQTMTLSDLQREMMKGFQQMQQQNVQALKEMQQESLKVMVDTLHHLAGVKAPQSSSISHLKPVGKKPEAVRKGSAYEAPIRDLWLKNPHISATEAGRRVGCSHVTAGTILKSLRPVTVTQVKEDTPLHPESGNGAQQSPSPESESA